MPAHGEDPAVGQGDAGGVPAAVSHRSRASPAILPPIEDVGQFDAGEVFHGSVTIRCSYVVLCSPPCYEDVTVGKQALTTAKEVPRGSPLGSLLHLLCSRIPEASGVK